MTWVLCILIIKMIDILFYIQMTVFQIPDDVWHERLRQVESEWRERLERAEKKVGFEYLHMIQTSK